MRLAKKLGFLGLALALVAAFGLVHGSATPAQAQASPENCVQVTLSSANGIQCSFSTNAAQSASFPMTLAASTGSIVSVAGLPSSCTVAGTGTSTVTVTNCSFNAGAALTVTLSATGTVPVTVTATYNVGSNGTSAIPAPVSGNAGASCSITTAVATVPNTVGGGTSIEESPANVWSCGAFIPAAVGPGGVIEVILAAPADSTNEASGQGAAAPIPQISVNVGGQPPSIDGCLSTSGAPTGFNPQPGQALLFFLCSSGAQVPAGTPLVIGGISCSTCEIITGQTAPVVNGGCGPATTTIIPGAGAIDPDDCGPTSQPPIVVNVISNANGPSGAGPAQSTQVINFTFSQGLEPDVISINCGGTVITTNGSSINLPLFGGATTCTISPKTLGGATPVSDGSFQVSIVNATGVTGVLGCDGASVAPSAQPCSNQNSGQTVNLPCGTTAPAGTTVSETCSAASFTIQSSLANCVSNPTLGCPNFNLNSTGSIQIDVKWFSTPGNGGSTGGKDLGLFNFGLQGQTAPGVLLVTASPQIVPSNGTLASVITATFACGTGFSIVNGIPLSNGAASGNNQALLGSNPLTSPNSTVCGAGLPGTFTFSTPGPVIFDNGRSQESVSCGISGQYNAFGVGANPFFPTTGSTLPLVFTCTGAAVLAIGAGAAGDAPINVVYTSQIGGLTAIGSTLITVSPSGVPRISIGCSPTTIAAGSPGSICTATVTDINGVPLTGITGATVTFTVSDPTEATILPCVVSIPGSINITTVPNILPQIVPQTPCITPSGTIPAQANTFVNGQATALLVASPTAHPETVTVSASLGIEIPPSFACLVSPYVPTVNTGITTGILNQIVTGYTAATSVGLPGVTGCGTASPVGLTGLATALSTATGSLSGIVTLPNATSASTTVNIGGVAGILIAGATPTQPLQLSRGCNQVIVTSYAGTPIANIAALVSPQSAVVSIWRFSNSTKQFQAGFFSDPQAPTDFVATGSISGANNAVVLATNPGTAGNQLTETYFVCVNAASTIISG